MAGEALPLPWPLLPDATRPQTVDEIARKAQENFDALARAAATRIWIAGEIAANGAINRGQGFTAVRNGVGDYTVTFSNTLPSIPVVVLTCGSDAAYGSVRHYPGQPPTTTTFRVVTYNPPATAVQDMIFDFIATI